MSLSKRLALLEQQEKSKSQALPRDTGYLDSKAPVLLEMMTVVPKGAADDKTASFTVFCEDGEFKVLVNDRAIGRKAWLRIASLGPDFFEVLEDFVSADHTDWRYPRPPANGSYRS